MNALRRRILITMIAAGTLMAAAPNPTRAQDPDVVVGAGKDGFYLQSRGGAFTLKFRGGFQANSRFFPADRKRLNLDTFLGRRIRPILEGTVQERYDFRLLFDLADSKSSLLDAYLDVRPSDAVKIRFGKFKVPVGLERLQSFGDVRFVELGFPTSMVPNRDYGVMVHGDVSKGLLAYAAGLMNGVPDGTSGDSDVNDAKDLVGRLFVQPFTHAEGSPLNGLGIGLGATWGDQAGAPPSYKSTGQATIFSFGPSVTADGKRTRIHPQAYFYSGPLGIMTEYSSSRQIVKDGGKKTDLTNVAWQAAATCFLTGEKASYRTITPNSPLNFYGGSGAVELAARYQRLDIDPVAFDHQLGDRAKSVSRAATWTGGVNWYLNRSVRFTVNYELTEFRLGAAGGGNRPVERVIETLYQFIF